MCSFLKKINKIPKEVKASVAYTICNILVKCLSLITLPIFTRIMSIEDYGLSTVYSSTSAMIIIFTSLQLPHGTLATAMIKFKDDRIGYLSSLCSISSILTLLYCFACFIFKDAFVKILNMPFYLLIFMGIDCLFTTVRSAWMGWQRFEYKYKNVVAITLLTSVMSVVVSLIVVLNSVNKGVNRVISNAIIGIIIGALIYISLIYKGRKPFEKKYWHFALSFNLPLVPYYLSQVVFNQSDRLMIDNICGRTDAAIYGVAYSLATILTFVVTSIQSSYTPWLYSKIEKEDYDAVGKISSIISLGISFVLTGIIILAPEIVTIMASEKYKQAIWAVPPVAMSVLLLYYANLFDSLLFYFESKAFLVFSSIVSAIINIILNAIFIPRYGFVIAAYTTLISYLFLSIGNYLYMIKICKINNIHTSIYNIKNLIIIFVLFAMAGFFAMSLYKKVIVRYVIVFIVIAISLNYRKVIYNIYSNLKKE